RRCASGSWRRWTGYFGRGGRPRGAPGWGSGAPAPSPAPGPGRGLANAPPKLRGGAGGGGRRGPAPGFAPSLGGTKGPEVERRRELLLAAVGRRPGDLALLMTLGTYYTNNRREWADERLRWFQAAVAAAPGNAAALNDLGLALNDKGLSDEAIAYFRKAIEADPTLANAHNNLGLV